MPKKIEHTKMKIAPMLNTPDNTELEKVANDDMLLLNEFMKEKGGIPPVLFIHFKDINKDIAKMMNQSSRGNIKVKNGFYIAINDPFAITYRHDFVGYLGAVMATLKILGVIPEPESIVMCTEAWASRKEGVRPSKDPEAIDALVLTALSIKNEKYLKIFEKRVKVTNSNKVDDSMFSVEFVSNSELDEMGKEGTSELPLLDKFYESYNEGLIEMNKNRELKRFKESADTDPVSLFQQAVSAAFAMTKIQAEREGNRL